MRRVVPRGEIENRIIDAASIYAGAEAYFEYARRGETDLPVALTWDSIAMALSNMGFWKNEHPALHERLRQREMLSAEPF
jgi:hypothetical protein